MYSVVRENFYDSGKLSRADKEVTEFQSIQLPSLAIAATSSWIWEEGTC